MIQDASPLMIFDLFATMTEAKPLWYSGRGMYGKSCLGITGTWQTCQTAMFEVISHMHDAVVEEIHENSDDIDLAKTSQPFYDLVETLLSFSSDNMGLEVVVYFRNIQGPTE